MGTQAPLYLLPSRIAYADLQHESTKRFDRCLPLQYESGNYSYNDTSPVPVSAKKMSPLQQMVDKTKVCYMEVSKPSSMQTRWRSVARCYCGSLCCSSPPYQTQPMRRSAVLHFF